MARTELSQIRDLDVARLNRILRQPRKIQMITAYLNSDALTDEGVEWALTSDEKFAVSLRGAIKRWGAWTERQAAAVNRAAANHAKPGHDVHVNTTNLAPWPEDYTPETLLLRILRVRTEMVYAGTSARTKAMAVVELPAERAGALVWFTLPRKVSDAFLAEDPEHTVGDMVGVRMCSDMEVRASTENPALAFGKRPHNNFYLGRRE